MDHLTFFILGAVVIGLVVYGVFFNKAALIRRKLRSVQEKPLALIQEGDETKVKGTVVAIGRTLKAPLSGRSCVYYHVLVEESRQSGKSHSWHDLIEEEVSGDLVLKNGSDYIVIDTSLVKCHLVDDAKYSSGFMNDAAPALEAYLAKHREKSVGFFGLNKGMRYKEGIVEEGETVVVAGTAHWKKKSDFRFNIPQQRVLVMSAAGVEAPLYMSDDPDVTA